MDTDFNLKALIVAKKNFMGDEMEKSTKETTVQQTPNQKSSCFSCYGYANNPIKSIDLAVKGFGYRMSTRHSTTSQNETLPPAVYFQFLSSLFALLGFYGEVVHPAARPSVNPSSQSPLKRHEIDHPTRPLWIHSAMCRPPVSNYNPWLTADGKKKGIGKKKGKFKRWQKMKKRKSSIEFVE